MDNFKEIGTKANFETGAFIEFIRARRSHRHFKKVEFMAKSPAGRIPVLETPHGFLTETNVIIDYIDETCDGPSFYPTDPFAKAKVRELMKHLELYIEQPTHQLFPVAFMGGTVEEHVIKDMRPLLEEGFASIKTLAESDPYIAGKEITYADFYSQYSLALATAVTRSVYKWNTLDELPKFKELLKILNQREAAKKVAADMNAAFAKRNQ
jgi:glutathione S-transferase